MRWDPRSVSRAGKGGKKFLWFFAFLVLIFGVFVVFCGVKERRPQEIGRDYLTG